MLIHDFLDHPCKLNQLTLEELSSLCKDVQQTRRLYLLNNKDVTKLDALYIAILLLMEQTQNEDPFFNEWEDKLCEEILKMENTKIIDYLHQLIRQSGEIYLQTFNETQLKRFINASTLLYDYLQNTYQLVPLKTDSPLFEIPFKGVTKQDVNNWLKKIDELWPSEINQLSLSVIWQISTTYVTISMILGTITK